MKNRHCETPGYYFEQLAMGVTGDLPDSSMLRGTRPSSDKVDFASLTTNTLPTILTIVFRGDPPRDNLHSIRCDSALYRLVY